MRHLIFLLALVVFTSCGNETNTTNSTSEVSNADSLDSVRKVEEEVSEELIEGSFDALNR